jgi:hypothetical protein
MRSRHLERRRDNDKKGTRTSCPLAYQRCETFAYTCEACARVYLKVRWGSVTDKGWPGALLQAQGRSGMKTGKRKDLQPALSTSGEWRIWFAVAVAVAACGGKGGLCFTGDSSQDGVGIPSRGAGGETADGLGGSGGGGMAGMGGVTTAGGMTTAGGGVTSQGGSAGTEQDGGVNDSAFGESPDSSGDEFVVGIDAGTGCPPAPTVYTSYPSQLLTDPTSGCVLSVLYINSDAGLNCPPLSLPPTLCLSSLLPLADPETGCATGFRCAIPTDCALGAACPTTDAGVACPPVTFPSQFCVVLLTLVDPTTGCVAGFTCKSPVPF